MKSEIRTSRGKNNLMGVFRFINRFLSPGGPEGKLLVFIFHRVLEKPDPLQPYEPTVDQFEWMMKQVAANFNVLRLEEAVQRLAENRLPPAAACITFDDGYRDNAELAKPVLVRHGLVGTFFIATAFLGSGRMWNDDIVEAIRKLGAEHADWQKYGLGSHRLTTSQERLRCLAEVLPKLKYFPHLEREQIAREIAQRSCVSDDSALMMDCEHIRSMVAAGMEIGAHTHSHPILSQISADEVQSEIGQGRAILESITGHPIRVLAYPNGDSSRDLSVRDADLIRNMGFVCAMTTDRGVSDGNTHPFLMPRFTPWDRTPARFGIRCALALKENAKI